MRVYAVITTDWTERGTHVLGPYDTDHEARDAIERWHAAHPTPCGGYTSYHTEGER